MIRIAHQLLGLFRRHRARDAVAGWRRHSDGSPTLRQRDLVAAARPAVVGARSAVHADQLRDAIAERL